MGDVRQIYRGRVVRLTVEDVALPNGHQLALEIIRHPGAAAIVALDDDGAVTLLRQYRHAVGGYLWEVPAGTLDEDPVERPTRNIWAGSRAIWEVPAANLPSFEEEAPRSP